MKVQFLLQKSNTLHFNASQSEDLYKDFSASSQVLTHDCFINSFHNPIKEALTELEQLEFKRDDVEKIKPFVSKITFHSGKEAVDFLKKNNIKIIFDKFKDKEIQAQWTNQDKCLTINKKYAKNTDKTSICEISAAIIHELTHAKDNDCDNSIQEEIDCLAMNALVFKTLKDKYPKEFSTVKPQNNNCLWIYEKLFFKQDIKGLKTRIMQKYGHLPLASLNHNPNQFAKSIIKKRN